MHDRKRIVLLPGDGIGSEVMAQGVKLLHAMEEPLGIAFEFEEHAIGGAGLKVALPHDATVSAKYYRFSTDYSDGLSDIVPVRFAVMDPAQHYHVPMLCSPWFFSTYRGS